METNRYMKRPVYVDAIKVTHFNLSDVAEWCGGSVSRSLEMGNWVNVPHVPASNNRAYISNYVVKNVNGTLSIAKQDDFERVYVKA